MCRAPRKVGGLEFDRLYGRYHVLHTFLAVTELLCVRLVPCGGHQPSPVVATGDLQVQHLRYGWWDEQLVFKQLFSMNSI